MKDLLEWVMNIAEESVEKLREAEWSSFSSGPPAYMGGPSIGGCKACPVCGGLDPNKPDGGFIDEAFGHRKKCRLAKLIDAPKKSYKK